MGKIKLILGASILLLVSSAQASTLRTAITIDGLDWAQISDSTAASGLEVLSLCSENLVGGGPCSGVTANSGIDLTGWYWAMEDQAIKLASDVLGISWDGADKQNVDTSKWFDSFDETGGEAGADFTIGIYQTPNSIEMLSLDVLALAPFYNDSPGTLSSGPCPTCLGDGKFWYGLDSYPTGFLLYRPSEVPVPAAAWLFGTALIGLVGFSKRRKAA